MGIRDELKNRSAGLFAEPRLFRALQSERLSRALTALLDASGRLTSSAADQQARVAQALGLASLEELRRLEQRVAALEAEVAKLRQDR